jgi:translocation and assembly module TamA
MSTRVEVPANPALRLLACFAVIVVLLPSQVTAQSKVRVEIEGVDAELERNVRAIMEIAREAETGLMTRQRIDRLHVRAVNDIEVALQPFGYYQPHIEKSLEPDGDALIARYVVDPGVQVHVRMVEITLTGPGKDDQAFLDAKAAFPLHPGDPLRHALYETGKLRLLSVASDSGYLDADFDSSAVRVDKEAGQADVRIVFETGERFHFGPVWFDQDILDESFLNTRVPFQQGTPWRQDKLLELQTMLSEDPYFARVEVLPRRDSAQGLEVPIRVALAPQPRQEYEFGAGYGTDTGPRGRAASYWRRLNPRGHYARGDLKLSMVEQLGTAEYSIPAVTHPTGVLTFFTGYVRRIPTTNRSNTATIGTRLTRKRFGWRETWSLQWQHEDFVVGVDTGSSVLVVPSTGWERSRADHVAFPRRGYRVQFQGQGALKGLVSNATFLKVGAAGKIVYGFAPQFRVLARAETGRILTQEFHELPATIRYFTGGDLSVRGFGYQDLGTRDSLGNIIGGQSLLVSSLEVDFWPMPRGGIALFTDAGNAMQHFSIGDLQYSVGAGIRYLSPLGMLRLDGAFPVSAPGRAFRIHISVGPDI